MRADRSRNDRAARARDREVVDRAGGHAHADVRVGAHLELVDVQNAVTVDVAVRGFERAQRRLQRTGVDCAGAVHRQRATERFRRRTEAAVERLVTQRAGRLATWDLPLVFHHRGERPGCGRRPR